ncbi:MAG: SRPBCC family protein [Gammaproteobacteria bacterium]
MPVIRTAISIGLSMDRVFEFVTTPSNSPKWCHSSWKMVTDHPLQPGERVIEDLSVAGRHVCIEWTVRESQPPRLWVIVGKTEDGGTATMTYTLTAEPNGTRFKRELLYNIRALFDEQGGFLSLRNRLQADLAESLRRLKRILEDSMAAYRGAGVR